MTELISVLAEKNSWWVCQRLKRDVLFCPMLSLVNVAKSHWDAGTVSMWVKSCSRRSCFSVLLGVGYSALMLVEVVPASRTRLSVLITATAADLLHLTPMLASLFFMLLCVCCLTLWSLSNWLISSRKRCYKFLLNKLNNIMFQTLSVNGYSVFSCINF